MSRNDAERGLFELYEEDPERADRLLFGRIAYANRRGFLRGAGLATMTALVGASIPFHRHIPAGFIPMALVVSDSWWKLVFGVAPDHDGCSIRRRGQSAA